MKGRLPGSAGVSCLILLLALPPLCNFALLCKVSTEAFMTANAAGGTWAVTS